MEVVDPFLVVVVILPSVVEVEAFPFQVVEVESPLVVEEAYQNLEVKEGIPSEVEEVAFPFTEEVAVKSLLVVKIASYHLEEE